MREKVKPRNVWLPVCLLLLLMATVGIASVVSAEAPTTGSVSPLAGINTVRGAQNVMVTKLFGQLGLATDDRSQQVQVTDLSREIYVIDLPSMGVHPIQGTPPRSVLPDGGAVGLGGAFMSISPEVVSQSVSSEVGILSASWTPNEMVAFSVNGGAPINVTASSTGRIGIYLNVGSGQGWITLEQRGLTSGRQTGGVVEVHDAASPLPGLAIGPHAINPNGSSTINVLGTRWHPGNVTLARNGTAINTLTAGASGTFYYAINVPAGADTSSIYSAYTATVGSRVGQSIEERADAGVPPYGDQNVTRALIDRPVVASTGGTVAIVGEGFQPGETVNVTTCGTLSGTADSNGAYRFFAGLSGLGVGQCVLTGAVSGRVARASTLVSNDAINAPGIIVAPAAVVGTGNVTLIIDRLLPNQSGTVYRDGVSLGTFSTDSGGKAAAFVGKPTSGFVHDYRWVGVSGQSVSAPLLYLPAGGTPTRTRTPTNTPTHTAVMPTHTPTNTPTRTAVIPTHTPTRTHTPLPTQTPGGPTATPVPSNTPTTPAQDTATPTFTFTHTPLAGSATSTPTQCPLQFTDVPQGSTFYPFVRCMACRGIVNGYSTGCGTGNPCFRPNNNVTRGQLAKIVSNSAGFNDPAGNQLFEDVPPGSTFYDYVYRLASRGYINGYPCGGAGEPCVAPDNLPYFRTNNNATRGQISKIVSNAAGFQDPPGDQIFEDVAPGSTFYDFIQRLAGRGVMNGYPCGGQGEPCVPPDNRPYFRPNNNATRGQTSKIVANTFFPDCYTPFDNPDTSSRR